MNELLALELTPVVVTLAAFQAGRLLQKKFPSPLCNPTLIGMILVIVFLLLTGMAPGTYQAAMVRLSWLMTPATICLAIPMYEQFQALKQNLGAIALGVLVGAAGSMAVILACGLVMGLPDSLILSLLPKSVTTAIGAPLSELFGGLGGVTIAAIIVTGISCNMMGPGLCRLFRITDPAAQGVAFGTAGHVIGTAKANELGELTGAVSSLSLVAAGVFTAALFPLLRLIL
ncbi:MAG: LrgB family protein [Eubacteriales bacterium]|nr:LrgB family protein [Eubacteriales bacterium]